MDTKEEFYKSFIEVQIKHGQGLSGIVKVHGGPDIRQWMEELIEEGLMKACDTGGSIGHPESNIFYMPTKGYNVWEDEDPKEYSRHKGRYLHCVRYYLDCLEPGQREIHTRNVEFMEIYAKWLKRNEKELDIMLKLDPFYAAPVIKFSKDEEKWIKERGWYKDNKTVADCLKQSMGGFEDDEKKIEILNKLIPLYESSIKDGGKTHITSLKEAQEDIVDTKKGIFTRKKVNNWLGRQDKKAKIQTCLK